VVSGEWSEERGKIQERGIDGNKKMEMI